MSAGLVEGGVVGRGAGNAGAVHEGGGRDSGRRSGRDGAGAVFATRGEHGAGRSDGEYRGDDLPAATGGGGRARDGVAVSAAGHHGAARLRREAAGAPLWWAIVRLSGWGAVTVGVSLWFTARMLASLAVTLLRTRGAEAAFGRALGEAGLPPEAVGRLTDIYGGPIRRVRRLARLRTWLRRPRA